MYPKCSKNTKDPTNFNILQWILLWKLLMWVFIVIFFFHQLFYSEKLSPFPHLLIYPVFICVKVILKISFLSQIFLYFSSFTFPHEFGNILMDIYTKAWLGFDWDSIQFMDYWGRIDWHLYSNESFNLWWWCISSFI